MDVLDKLHKAATRRAHAIITDDGSVDENRLRELAEAATRGPWVECGHARGGCTCGYVWSEPADAPIAQATIGEWGDEYPSMRPASGSIEGKFEAYMERITYGVIDSEKGKANARYIAAVYPSVVLRLLSTLDYYRRRVRELETAPVEGEALGRIKQCR